MARKECRPAAGCYTEHQCDSKGQGQRAVLRRYLLLSLVRFRGRGSCSICPSLGELGRLVKEEAWTARLQALVAIGNRLRAANSQPHTTDPNAHHNVDSNDNLDILSSGLLTGYVEVALERLSDVHQRVALEAHNVVQLCVDRHGHSDTMKTKLGACLCISSIV